MKDSEDNESEGNYAKRGALCGKEEGDGNESTREAGKTA